MYVVAMRLLGGDMLFKDIVTKIADFSHRNRGTTCYWISNCKDKIEQLLERYLKDEPLIIKKKDTAKTRGKVTDEDFARLKVFIADHKRERSFQPLTVDTMAVPPLLLYI